MNLNLDGLDGFLENKIAELNVPGIAIGIVKNGETVYNKGFGYADIENKVKMTPDHVLRVGSISKTFLSIGLMQQWELGKFQLDDDINKYLPFGKVRAKNKSASPITFKHLFTHTAGIGEIYKISALLHFKRLVSNNEEDIATLEELYRKGFKNKVPPGEKFAYANFGANLLGYLLEIISGENFSEYVRTNILDSIGMNRSDFLWSESVKRHQAKGYKLKKGRNIESGTKLQTTQPAGALYASINDMLKYISCLLNEGKCGSTQIIKPDTLSKMFQPHFQLDPRQPAMGLLFRISYLNGLKVIEHGGAITGYLAQMYIIPELDFGMISIVNQMSLSNYKPTQIFHETLRRILNVKNPKEELETLQKFADVAEFPKFVGRYGPTKGFLTNIRHYMAGGEYKIHVKNKELTMKTLRGSKKKGIKMYFADKNDKNHFKIIDKMGYSTIYPYEDVIFTENDKGEIISFNSRYQEYFKKKWYNSFKFKIYALIIGIPTLIIVFMIFNLFLI